MNISIEFLEDVTYAEWNWSSFSLFLSIGLIEFRIMILKIKKNKFFCHYHSHQRLIQSLFDFYYNIDYVIQNCEFSYIEVHRYIMHKHKNDNKTLIEDHYIT